MVVMAGCVTSGGQTREPADARALGERASNADAPSADAPAASVKAPDPDYLRIEIIFPTTIRTYMTQFRRGLLSSDAFTISNIRPHSAGMHAIDLRANIEAIHRQYPFIQYDAAGAEVTLDTAAMVALLRAPEGFFPPPELNLSEEEVIEFYRWQFAGIVDGKRVASLMNSITIGIAVELNSKGDTVAQRDSGSLLDLLSGSRTLAVSARYR